MKAIIISVTLLLLVVIVVFANNIYISNVTEKLKSLVEDISQGNNINKAIDELEKLWNDTRKFTALSVSLDEIDQTTEHLISLSIACSFEDDLTIRRYCALLINDFDDLGRYEKFSILNIF